VELDGFGAWEVALRWSKTDLSDDGGDHGYVRSVALSWYPTDPVRISLSLHRAIWNPSEAARATPPWVNCRSSCDCDPPSRWSASSGWRASRSRGRSAGWKLFQRDVTARGAVAFAALEDARRRGVRAQVNRWSIPSACGRRLQIPADCAAVPPSAAAHFGCDEGSGERGPIERICRGRWHPQTRYARRVLHVDV